MSIIIVFIECILGLGLLAFLGWGSWILVKDPAKIKGFFQKMTDNSYTDSNIAKNEEQPTPSQEEIIRNIVREEIERMSNHIIRSYPQPVNISQNEIVNEIKYNRQLLERLIVSLDKKQEEPRNEAEIVPSRQYPQTKFARMVDCSSPEGFQMSSLSDISKGACYQITILSENQANYRLITNPNLQQEIIAMFNPIITAGCEYSEEPTAINEIIHLEDGSLELYSGIWHIVKKAKIKFI